MAGTEEVKMLDKITDKTYAFEEVVKWSTEVNGETIYLQTMVFRGDGKGTVDYIKWVGLKNKRLHCTKAFIGKRGLLYFVVKGEKVYVCDLQSNPIKILIETTKEVYYK